MSGVPGPVQNVIDEVDAQIQKDRSPVVNVLLALPMYLIVALPLGFIVGVVVTIAVGTNSPMISQANTTPGIIAGILTILFFTAFAVYGTYTSSN